MLVGTVVTIVRRPRLLMHDVKNAGKGYFMTNEINFETIDISGEAPSHEPERQYYFMKKAQGLLAKKEAEAGRKLSACIKTFGCPKNDV